MSSTRSHRRYPFAEIGVSVVLATLLLTTVYLQAAQNPGAVQANNQARQPRIQQALLPLPDGAKLFFTSTDRPSLLAAQAALARPISGQSAATANITRLVSWDNGEMQAVDSARRSEPATGHGGPNVAGEVSPSPNGKWLAVQTYFGGTPVAWVVDLQRSKTPTLTSLTAEGAGLFLGWHPDGQRALYSPRNAGAADSGLWLVNAADGTHQRLPIPDLVAAEGLLAAAFSPDGSKIVYATSKGMGFGSEIWLSELNGANRKLLLKDELTIISSLSWAPDGSKIAFTKILDSPVPFSAAGLWVVQANGGKPQFLVVMDGGRGQKPLWSKDSRYLFYVARENYDEAEANYRTELLKSSIKAVDVQTRRAQTLAADSGARQIDLSQTPEGNLLFSSNRTGSQEVWHVDTKTNRLRQLTFDGEGKRYPVLVAPPVSSP